MRAELLLHKHSNFVACRALTEAVGSGLQIEIIVPWKKIGAEETHCSQEKEV